MDGMRSAGGSNIDQTGPDRAGDFLGGRARHPSQRLQRTLPGRAHTVKLYNSGQVPPASSGICSAQGSARGGGAV